MKHLLGGVAVVAVLALSAPLWAQNASTPPNNTPSTGTAPITQPAPNPPPLPQAQQQQNAPASQAQAPSQKQNAAGSKTEQEHGNRATGEAQRERNADKGEVREHGNRETHGNATHEEHERVTETRRMHHRWYGRGMAYRMHEPMGHVRYAQEWRMHHHHWRHAQAWRFRHHNWRYARAWEYGYGPYGYSHRWYGWHRHWPTDFQAEQLNRQELSTVGTMSTTQYYGASGPAMAYAPSAGFEGPRPAPMGYGGSVLWYPPRSNPPSPPGFPPPFYGLWAW